MIAPEVEPPPHLTLAQSLGAAYVRYVLNAPPDHPLESLHLSDSQLAAAKMLVGTGGPPAPRLTSVTEKAVLGRYLPGERTSLTNALRRTAGGALERATREDDPVADALVRVAADVWPLYLIKPDRDDSRPFSIYSSAVMDHPVFDDVVEEFLRDRTLMQLFPHPREDSPTAHKRWYAGFGYDTLLVTDLGGGSVQLVTLASGLIGQAALRCLANGAQLSLGGIAPHVVQTVGDLRSLAAGQAVEVPTLVGLTGVSVAADTVITLPSGVLRAATDVDRELLPSVTASVDSVFETTSTFQIYTNLENRSEEGQDPFRGRFEGSQGRRDAARRSFTHKLDQVRLSMLLASSADSPWLAREVVRLTLAPTNYGGVLFGESAFGALPVQELSSEHAADVMRWHALVMANHAPSLDIGMRRLLAAATSRSDPIDAFVDAVICWESLFGVEQETTFRVTATISKLLRRSVSERVALQKELSEIYRQRSRLVHGAAEPSPVKLGQMRQRAIDIALDCLRAIYRERSDLIELEPSPRGARVLLE